MWRWEPIFHVRIKRVPGRCQCIASFPGLGVDPVQIVQIVHQKMAQNQTVGFQNDLHFPMLLSETHDILKKLLRPSPLSSRNTDAIRKNQKAAGKARGQSCIRGNRRRQLIPAGFSAQPKACRPCGAWRFARRPFPMRQSLQHPELLVPQVGDKHVPRGVGNHEIGFHFHRHRLGRDAAGPEDREPPPPGS